MARHRFGEGEYRYFAEPFPEAVAGLQAGAVPASCCRSPATGGAKLGRDTPWPDSLDEWLDMCHAAGQTRPTPILLKYGPGDWNALHRDLYGELVFPLQVVINLNDPGVDHTGGEFLLYEQRPRAQSRGTATLIPHGHGLVFTTRDRPVPSARGWSAAPGAARRVGDPLRPAVHPRARLPRRRLMATPPEPTAAAGHWQRYTLLGADRRPTAARPPARSAGTAAARSTAGSTARAALRAIAAGGYVAHRVFFADEPTAVAAGYRPCAVCLPQAYRTWKTR